MELNREQVMKALESLERCSADDGCVGDKCPYYATCQFFITRISKDIFSPIKELNEENERLRAIPEQLHKEMSERMVEERKIERKLTVRKMQERLHKRFKRDIDVLYTGYHIHRYIDQIAKEMLEEGK